MMYNIGICLIGLVATAMAFLGIAFAYYQCKEWKCMVENYFLMRKINKAMIEINGITKSIMDDQHKKGLLQAKK